MKIDRRQFLKLTGAGVFSLLTPLSLPETVPPSYAANRSIPGPYEERFHMCEVCSNQCATILKLQNGKIREIVGNPADQLGCYGKVCVKGASAMRLLYDPDRLKTPLKRTNPKKGKGEDPKWVKISWEEAFKLVGSKFKQTIKEHGAESILFIAQPIEEITYLQKCIGTPNFVSHGDTCYLSQLVAWLTTTGTGHSITMDLANTKYILGFGWDQPGKSKMAYLQGFLKARENGAKVVIFDPRLSTTAANADEWIPIKPGTDLAVVLAMIHVIIKEGLYNKDFVEKYTSGFEQLAEHVKQYTPEWASEISEVPVDVIVRIAREFATTPPAFIPTHKRDASGPAYFNSGELARAQLIMCALVGSIDRVGGWVFKRTLSKTSISAVTRGKKYPKMSKKKKITGEDYYPLVKNKRVTGFLTVADALVSGKPYPIKAAFCAYYNIRSFPNPDKLVEGLKKLDFCVVSDVMPSEITLMADVILPETMFLERSGIQTRATNALWPQAMLQEGVKKLYDNKSMGEIVNGILDGMGRSDLKVNWVGLTKRRFRDLGTSPEQMRANKGIFEKREPFEPTTEFSTPSKKIELYSTQLAKKKLRPLPTWFEKRAKPSKNYPFYLLTHHTPWTRMGKLQNDSFILEIQPENLLHIHPETAKKLGIANGDYTIVSSPTGKRLKIRAKYTEGIRKDCVMTEHGYGAWSPFLSVAYGHGTNDGDLLPDITVKQNRDWAKKIADMCPGYTDVCVGVEKFGV